MAPSSLLFYLGLDKKVEKLRHHNLFFDESFNQHAIEIYDDPQMAEQPAVLRLCAFNYGRHGGTRRKRKCVYTNPGCTRFKR